MTRVVSYIDGFNLYFGMRSSGLRRFLWLDVEEMSRRLLLSVQSLELVRYYTTVIPSPPDRNRRHQDYVDIISSLGKTVTKFGHFKGKPPNMREKQTDVNIATDLLVDAIDDKFDLAILVTGDSDLVPAVSAVRTRFPSKRVLSAFPPGRISNELISASSAYMHIRRSVLRNSQLLDPFTLPNGTRISRPPDWA